ncbi:necrosis inducing protein-domain-containing protein [Aspergillus ambiguus]|uniref:necrosis inducing protein-domain-containing protein n=1 Tax=Aspergillus ambiguus TaxID=176160 RepID=UPI003CCD47D9
MANLLTPFPISASEGAQKFQPVLDFDTDSCYHTAAIGIDGQLNKGIEIPHLPEPQPTSWLVPALVANDTAIRSGPNLRGCRERDRLDKSQVYHIIVWTLNDNVFFVSWSAHSKYTTHHQSTVRFEGTHPKMVYHLGGWGTHSFRKAEAKDEQIENHTGHWFKAPLVSLEKLPCEVNRKLLNNNWGSAQPDLRKDRFGTTLNDWMPWDARHNDKFNPWEPVVPPWAA